MTVEIRIPLIVNTELDVEMYADEYIRIIARSIDSVDYLCRCATVNNIIRFELEHARHDSPSYADVYNIVFTISDDEATMYYLKGGM